jgi:hypothetical protein
LLIQVGTAVHLALATGQLHGKGKAGGIPALLAVLAGKELVDIKSF